MEWHVRRGRSRLYGTWSAQNSAEAQDAAVEALLSEGLDANMIRFETGTVCKEGQTGMEHMASFNYAYKLEAVRDWLYVQRNNGIIALKKHAFRPGVEMKKALENKQYAH